MRKLVKTTAEMETLEGRRLLAASVSQGVLNIRGTRSDDEIRVRR